MNRDDRNYTNFDDDYYDNDDHHICTGSEDNKIHYVVCVKTICDCDKHEQAACQRAHAVLLESETAYFASFLFNHQTSLAWLTVRVGNCIQEMGYHSYHHLT